jgi:hypothetical protein
MFSHGWDVRRQRQFESLSYLAAERKSKPTTVALTHQRFGIVKMEKRGLAGEGPPSRGLMQFESRRPLISTGLEPGDQCWVREMETV